MKAAKFITKSEYTAIEECNCGGPVLKFHNTSKNEFVARCGYFKKIIEIDRQTKRKIWITPKRPACDWRVVYPGERPVFKEINNVLVKSVTVDKRTHNEQLEESLKILFSFLHISNHSSTLDEINILVKNNLVRDPKFPEETFKEYEKRIFSKKIIDLSHTIPTPIVETNFTFYDSPCLRRTVPINCGNKPINKTRSAKNISQFIEVTDDEHSDTDAESEFESELGSEQEPATDDEEHSDFESESVFDEPVEDAEDPYEDTDAPDYYDD
jgi:hypothetical protein